MRPTQPRWCVPRWPRCRASVPARVPQLCSSRFLHIRMQSRRRRARNWNFSLGSIFPQASNSGAYMAILVVGSVAFDSIETPAGRVENCLGGAATFFSLAASYFTPVRVIAVVGEDFTSEHESVMT